MVLIGPRGCGKSSLVNAVLDDLQRNATAASLLSHASDRSFWVVRLQGSAITTDVQAFREIAAQLSMEEELHRQQCDGVCGKEKKCRSQHVVI
jgi:predicted ATPase